MREASQVKSARTPQFLDPIQAEMVEDSRTRDKANTATSCSMQNGKRKHKGTAGGQEAGRRCPGASTATAGQFGFDLLMKMGWQSGQGLGLRNQGDVVPVSAKLQMQSAKNKKGLGFKKGIGAPPSTGGEQRWCTNGDLVGQNNSETEPQPSSLPQQPSGHVGQPAGSMRSLQQSSANDDLMVGITAPLAPAPVPPAAALEVYDVRQRIIARQHAKKRPALASLQSTNCRVQEREQNQISSPRHATEERPDAVRSIHSCHTAADCMYAE